MNEEMNFKLKAFLNYIFVSPLTSKFYIFNLTYISWFLIFISLLFKEKIVSTISVILAVILYLIKEYRDGTYIYWYRNKKYPEYKDTLAKIREQKRLNTTPELINRENFGDGNKN